MKIRIDTVMYQLYIFPYLKITYDKWLNGNYEIIDTIKLIEEEINVYNFEVDNDSTYFAEDYLVHHMCELCSGYSKIL